MTDFIIGALFIVAALAGLTAQTAYALRIQRRHAPVVPELDAPAYEPGREAFLNPSPVVVEGEVLVALRVDASDAYRMQYPPAEIEANRRDDGDTTVHVMLALRPDLTPALITRWIRANHNPYAVGRWDVVEAYRHTGELDAEISSWTSDAPEANWRTGTLLVN